MALSLANRRGRREGRSQGLAPILFLSLPLYFTRLAPANVLPPDTVQLPVSHMKCQALVRPAICLSGRPNVNHDVIWHQYTNSRHLENTAVERQ